MNELSFISGFKTLTGYEPLPWQTRMYEEMVAKPPGSIPQRVALPTGLGKTNVIACWLLALMKCRGGVPRRLVYVVNRRTVVDQTTAEVEQVNVRINDIGGWFDEVKLSTLRGQHADNREWSEDPSRPAVICGTVDMIGSRLLFSGYGVGLKTRPLHAGFLGQDTLLIHDEAHLEPAFQKLVTSIAAEQQREQGRTGFGSPLRVMELSATVRQQAHDMDRNEVNPPFMLDDEDIAHDLVGQRVNAVKRLVLHPCDDKPVDRMIELALEYEPSGSAVLVFARSVKDASNILNKLNKVDSARVRTLTGTMRGLERENLVKNDPVFRRFMPATEDHDVEPQPGTVYLVATSAGEVGVNLSADHMVCDLTTFESMAQRLGRVNRFGDRDDTRVDVVYPTDLPDDKAEQAERKKKPGQQKGLVFYDAARRRTLELLQQLNGDASPAALAKLDPDACAKAYSPLPRMLDISDILFDAWSMTSITPPLTDAPLPGCPPVAAYLHGIAEWEPPRTQVGWREEVERINTPELLDKYPPAELLAEYPLKPHELLQDTTERVYEALGKMVKRLGEEAATHLPAWVIGERGAVSCKTLAELCELDKKAFVRELGDTTLLLPPKIGGLTEQGMLDGKAKQQTGHEPGYDVADQWLDTDGQPRRCRFIQDADKEASKAMRRVVRIELPKSNGDDEAGTESEAVEYWDWYIRPASAEDAGSRWSRVDQLLQEHLESAERHAREMVGRLGLVEREAQAVIHAAAWHDLGKDRAVWQTSIRNDAYPEKVLAKSRRAMLAVRLSRYRHEFGSALDVLDPDGPAAETYAAFDEPTRDLLIHLILAHHGRARPHFPVDECYDPKPGRDSAARDLAHETLRRYARLQRRYGRWYLAYLESLVRAADRLASEPATDAEDAKTNPTEVSA